MVSIQSMSVLCGEGCFQHFFSPPFPYTLNSKSQETAFPKGFVVGDAASHILDSF